MTFVVSGSIAFDTIIHTINNLYEQTRSLPEQFTISPFVPNIVNLPGGTAHNIAYNLWLLWHRANTIMLWAVGKDFVTEEHWEKYVDYGHILRDQQHHTAHARLLTDPIGSQIIPFHPGAMKSAQHLSLIDISVTNNQTRCIVSPNNLEAMIRHVHESHTRWWYTIFDPWQALWLFSREQMLECINKSNLLILNQSEYDAMLSVIWLQHQDIILLIERIIVTKWAEGLTLYEWHQHTHIDALAVESKDPTGAWDALRAWLLSWLSQWLSRNEALIKWSCLASISVQHHGGMSHHTTPDELDQLIKQWKA